MATAEAALLQLLFILLLSLPGAWAQTDGQTRLAEYERIGQEMQSLASRNAWSGVERSYDKLLETGIPLTAEEHHIGAQAALNRGDVATARERLTHALEVEDSSEYRDKITSIDGAYGPVSLQGDPGEVELTVEQMPFDPSKKAAVHFAQEQVDETGAFEGLLPEGSYQFGPLALQIRPGVHTERIDIRSDKYMRKLERQQRREARRNGD